MEILSDLFKFYHKASSTISKTKLFGWLYVDSALHLIMGIVLMLGLLKWKRVKSPLKAFFIILGLQLLKEFLDSFSLTASWHEAISDTLFTISYPTLVVLISSLKNKLN